MRTLLLLSRFSCPVHVISKQVLHKILDEAEEGETVVGISNWELDSAKMNRAVNLQRPPPTVDDLELTAKGAQLILACNAGDPIYREL